MRQTYRLTTVQLIALLIVSAIAGVCVAVVGIHSTPQPAGAATIHSRGQKTIRHSQRRRRWGALSSISRSAAETARRPARLQQAIRLADQDRGSRGGDPDRRRERD